VIESTGFQRGTNSCKVKRDDRTQVRWEMRRDLGGEGTIFGQQAEGTCEALFACLAGSLDPHFNSKQRAWRIVAR
jgi:hypothetical protein